MTENQSSWGKVVFIVSSSDSANTTGEWKRIKESLDRAGSNFSSDPIDHRPVTNTDDVREEISQAAKVQSRIVHFSGHGGDADTPEYLLKENGKEDSLKPDVLSRFFDFEGVENNSIKCVIFNFCDSSKFAEKVAAEHVEYAIGIAGAIATKAAIDFAEGFYGYLRDKEPNQLNVFHEACERGKSSIVGDDSQKYKIFPNPRISKPGVELIEPKEGSSIPLECEFSGTFINLPEPPRMWLYVEATLQRKFYLVPIGDCSPSKGTWKTKTSVGGEKDNNNTFRIGVIVVDEKVHSDLNETFGRDGLICLDPLPSGTSFGDRPVTRI